MKKAYVFPGQGSQFTGMGKELAESNAKVAEMFEQANDLLGFNLTAIMFEGSKEELMQTKVTQPAIYVHSVAAAVALGKDFQPEMLAGHSLGEISALVAGEVLNFEDGLTLVSRRALAMQSACENQPSTMAAVLGLEDEKVEAICAEIAGIVVPANYNCPGQLVISGSIEAIDAACEKLKEAGAKRALVLPVGGAFHSPLMEPARAELESAISQLNFAAPKAPVYQNVTAIGETDPEVIQTNLIAQLTSPVRWTQCVTQMVADGGTHFIEVGPGKVLQGLVKKIAPEAEVSGN